MTLFDEDGCSYLWVHTDLWFNALLWEFRKKINAMYFAIATMKDKNMHEYDQRLESVVFLCPQKNQSMDDLCDVQAISTDHCNQKMEPCGIWELYMLKIYSRMSSSQYASNHS